MGVGVVPMYYSITWGGGILQSLLQYYRFGKNMEGLKYVLLCVKSTHFVSNFICREDAFLGEYALIISTLFERDRNTNKILYSKIYKTLYW